MPALRFAVGNPLSVKCAANEQETTRPKRRAWAAMIKVCAERAMNFRALPIRLYTAHAVRLGPCSFWRMEVPTRGYLPRVGALTKLGFSHSRCVSKCIFHALPDMARNFYAVSAWPRHERNLVMPDFATYSRDCIAECQDRFWIPCGGSRFEF